MWTEDWQEMEKAVHEDGGRQKGFSLDSAEWSKVQTETKNREAFA
jgi:hypothetical protein